MSFSELREILGDSITLNHIFNNYMSDDQREDFVKHYMNMYDIESEEDYMCNIKADHILNELEQYLSSDELCDVESWLIYEFDL